MYAYVRGEDDHFVYERLKSKRDAEEWLACEIALYEICYKDPEFAILTNAEFKKQFPSESSTTFAKRRLGKRLRETIRFGQQILRPKS